MACTRRNLDHGDVAASLMGRELVLVAFSAYLGTYLMR
jgi:hypothetical protein